MNVYYLYHSPKDDKKFLIFTPEDEIIYFGASGYSDYTKHKDEKRKKRYIKRHRENENWGKSGIDTAGFWSRWILWNKPSLRASIRDTEDRFGIEIVGPRDI